MKNIELTADFLISEIVKLANNNDRDVMMRFFKTGKGEYGENDVFIGVRNSKVNEMTKDYKNMPLDEIEKLLMHPYHEVRAAGIYIMDKNCKLKTTSEEKRKAYYDLYIRKHQHINNWDLIDSGCVSVVGGYLHNKAKDKLYDLLQSDNMWERRTAMVSTLYFIRKKELVDAFQIATLLMKDPEDLIHKATGWMLRCAGKVNPDQLRAYLEKYAPQMARVTLRYAIEKLGKSEREYFMSLR